MAQLSGGPQGPPGLSQVEYRAPGATRSAEALERAFVASGKRLFAASLAHVEATQAALEARLAGDDERVEELVKQAIALLDERGLAAAEGGWLSQCAWESRVAPYAPRAAASRAGAELRELLRMLEHEGAEGRRKRSSSK